MDLRLFYFRMTSYYILRKTTSTWKQYWISDIKIINWFSWFTIFIWCPFSINIGVSYRHWCLHLENYSQIIKKWSKCYWMLQSQKKLFEKAMQNPLGYIFSFFRFLSMKRFLTKNIAFFSKYVTADSKMWLSDSYLGVQAH